MAGLQTCNTIVRRTIHATGTQATPTAAARSHPQTFARQDSSTPEQTLSEDNQASARQQGRTAEQVPAVHQPGAGASSDPQDAAQSADGTSRTAHLYAVADKRDLKRLEAAIEGMPVQQAERPATRATPTTAPPSTSAASTLHADDMRSAAEEGSSGRGAASPASVPRLDVLEADVVSMLAALCRLVARQPGLPTDEAFSYITASKHLAADVLLRVLDSPANPWDAISSATWATLRQPFCMVALRCTAVDVADSLPVAPLLFVAILLRTPLRLSLKAELGAFFPLLLLKPLESEKLPHTVLSATLDASIKLAKDAQFMVDLFVNYDCDLQAVNIFERWLSGLERAAMSADVSTAPGAAAKSAAIGCIATALGSLSAWVQTHEGRAEAAHGKETTSGAGEQETFEVRAAATRCLAALQQNSACAHRCGVMCEASVPSRASYLPRTGLHFSRQLAGHQGHEGQAGGRHAAIRLEAAERRAAAARQRGGWRVSRRDRRMDSQESACA
jgi:Guanine nucleotide exchange factor in Golgi transport N-terminal